MNAFRIASVLLLFVLLISCSEGRPKPRAAKTPDSPAITTTNLNEAIAEAIAQFGNRPRKDLPGMDEPTKFLYPIQRDEGGVQFWLSGNHVRSLMTMLSTEYGPPKLIQTNQQGQINVAYNPGQVGAAVSFFQGATPTETYTHVIITRPKPGWTNERNIK